MPDETDLSAEVAELRAEVEALRWWRDSHVCYAPAAGGCTCPSPAAAVPAAPPPCPVHGPVRIWTGHIPPYNVCGGAAAIPPTVVWNPGDPPLNIQYPTMGAAGCASTVYFAGA